MPQPGSGGTLEDAFGNHSLPHHDNTGSSIRHRLRHLPGDVSLSTLNPAQSGNRIKSHKGNKTHPRLSDGTKRSNRRLTEMLQKAGFLDKSRKTGSFTITETAASIAHMVYGHDERIFFSVSERGQRLKMTAWYILRAEGLYVGKDGKNLTPELAGAVIRNWLFKNMLGMSVEQYLASKIDPGNVTVGTLGAMLNAALPDAGKDLHALSEGRRMLFLKLWDYVLDAAFPFRSWPATDSVQSLSITDDVFVWMYSGMLWLADVGADFRNISAEEFQVVGKVLWDMAESGDILVSKMKYLRLPALLFQAMKRPNETRLKKEADYGDILKAVGDYAEYRRTIRAVNEDFRAKTEDFKNKIAGWKSRGNIADGYVSQCPRERLISMGREHPPENLIPGMYPKLLSQDEKLKDGKCLAKEAYLNGRTREGCPPADVTAEFTVKTRQAADAFAEVDEYFIAMALAELPLSEQDFIKNKNAVINKLSSKMTTHIGRGIYVREKVKELQNTDLFSVTVEEEERVYAFIAEDKGGYKVERLDRDPGKYIQHDLFGIRKAAKIFVNKDGKVLTPPIAAGFHLRRWDISFSKGVAITGNSTSSDNLVQHVKEKHQKEFYNQMYTAGYDASLSERSWNFFKHFIPFYDCATEKFPDNLGACMLDALTFLPVVAEAASLGGKFGMSLTRGARAGMSVAAKDIYAMKAITTPLLKEISLPTLREISSLGKNALRALDPGIEMLGCMGKYAYKGVAQLEGWVRSRKNAADIRVMDNLLKKIPVEKGIKTGQSVSPALLKMAYLPHTEIKVPVTAVGKKGGQHIYVMVNPETGEMFGKRYLECGNRIKRHNGAPCLFLQQEADSSSNISSLGSDFFAGEQSAVAELRDVIYPRRVLNANTNVALTSGNMQRAEAISSLQSEGYTVFGSGENALKQINQQLNPEAVFRAKRILDGARSASIIIDKVARILSQALEAGDLQLLSRMRAEIIDIVGVQSPEKVDDILHNIHLRTSLMADISGRLERNEGPAVVFFFNPDDTHQALVKPQDQSRTIFCNVNSNLASYHKFIMHEISHFTKTQDFIYQISPHGVAMTTKASISILLSFNNVNDFRQNIPEDRIRDLFALPADTLVTEAHYQAAYDIVNTPEFPVDMLKGNADSLVDFIETLDKKYVINDGQVRVLSH